MEAVLADGRVIDRLAGLPKDNTGYDLTGLLAGMTVEPPDAILGIVPSLSGGLLARVLSTRYRAPYGLIFQDLMGPGARQSGIIGGGTVASATVLAEGWAAAGARPISKREAAARHAVRMGEVSPRRPLGSTPRADGTALVVIVASFLLPYRTTASSSLGMLPSTL